MSCLPADLATGLASELVDNLKAIHAHHEGIPADLPQCIAAESIARRVSELELSLDMSTARVSELELALDGCTAMLHGFVLRSLADDTMQRIIFSATRDHPWCPRASAAALEWRKKVALK